MKRFFLWTLLALPLLLGGCVGDLIDLDETTEEEEIVLTDPGLSWSATSYEATLGGSNSFPTLTNEAGVSVTYASSDTNVATIAADGTVSLIATGTTTITAQSEATDTYKAGSARYTLTVIDSSEGGESDEGGQSDEGDQGKEGEENGEYGAVTTVFDSAGDSSSDDDISNTTFTRLIAITYSAGGASVSGYSDVSGVFDVSVSGNQVTITYSGEENVVYKLTGTASDGFFKLYSAKKQALWLNGVSITCSSGAAINNQSGKRTFVYVDGSNTLADGSSAAYSTSDDEDMKGVFFSEGQL
ncbi:MAG: carbohydrate-binding domain-containing protein, partial [Bacteroidales bacterium]|nr:carbohydrate-binding domain-containing protein [Bacteroidales bacterium]